jgi:hypothetical protein
MHISAGNIMADYARATREPFLNMHICGTETATEWQGKINLLFPNKNRKYELNLFIKDIWMELWNPVSAPPTKLFSQCLEISLNVILTTIKRSTFKSSKFKA